MTGIIFDIIFIVICIIEFTYHFFKDEYGKAILDFLTIFVFIFCLCSNVSVKETGKPIIAHLLEEKTVNVYVINSDNDTTFVGEIKNDTVYIVK